MTATDPRPVLAAMLAEKLAPAAATLAGACAEDMSAAPPPEDDRALAGHHRAGRAALRAPFVTPDGGAAACPGPDPGRRARAMRLRRPAGGRNESRTERYARTGCRACSLRMQNMTFHDTSGHIAREAGRAS